MSVELRRVEEALDNAVSTTFESMLFLESNHIGDSLTSDKDVAQVELSAEAPLRCSLSLSAPQATIAAFRDALFGDAPAAEDANGDLLAELLNVIAGNFLGEWDDAVPVSLGLPQLGERPSVAPKALLVTRAYEVNGGSVLLGVNVSLKD